MGVGCRFSVGLAAPISTFDLGARGRFLDCTMADSCPLLVRVSGTAVRQFFIAKIITTIGGMCYTIYLLHTYLIDGVGMLTERILSSSVMR